MRLLVICPYPEDRAPSQRFRFEQYLLGLEARGVDVEVRPLMDRPTYAAFHRRGGILRKSVSLARGLLGRLDDVRAAADADVVLLHREAFPAGGAFIERRLAATGTPLVFDFDDAIYLRDVSPANRWAAVLKRPRKTEEILSLATVVLAGNDHLAAYARRFAGDVRVLPTVIDTERYEASGRWRAGDGEPVTVGWTGSVTTIEHLRPLEDVLALLQERTGVRIRVIGAPGYEPRGFEAEVLPWRSETEVADLCGIDVGIMPLPDEEWAKGKCGLKLLQYMALGRPGVASPVGVNETIVEHGENGLLARTSGEWYRALERLVRDRELRERLGRRARETVERRYSVRATRDEFREALVDAGRSAGAGGAGEGT